MPSDTNAAFHYLSNISCRDIYALGQSKMTFIQVWRFMTLMLAAFSLSLSMAHLLELPQRMQFDRQLWVRVTVFMYK